MAWRGAIALIAVGLVFVGGVVAWQALPEDETTRATVNQALVAFRKEMRQNARYADDRRGPVPRFGVYTYRTRGSEDLDTTALSAGHSYHGTSTIALSPSPCGVTERWQVLVERWTESELCLGAETSRVRTVTEFHEFFGRSRLTRYTCRGGVSPYTDEPPGMTWSTTCTSDQGTVTNDARVAGIERVRVAGRTFEAVHVASDSVLEGDPDGTAERHTWLRRSDGLVLRRTSTSDAHVDASGGGDFEERFTLELLSLRPQR